MYTPEAIGCESLEPSGQPKDLQFLHKLPCNQDRRKISNPSLLWLSTGDTTPMSGEGPPPNAPAQDIGSRPGLPPARSEGAAARLAIQRQRLAEQRSRLLAGGCPNLLTHRPLYPLSSNFQTQLKRQLYKAATCISFCLLRCH